MTSAVILVLVECIQVFRNRFGSARSTLGAVIDRERMAAIGIGDALEPRLELGSTTWAGRFGQNNRGKNQD